MVSGLSAELWFSPVVGRAAVVPQIQRRGSSLACRGPPGGLPTH